VRAGRNSSPRQLLYRVGTRLIKLSLETALDAGRMSLVGQVVDETDATPVEVVPVRVVSGGTVLTAAVTNGLGEFELEFEPARDLSLSLSLPDVRPFPVRVSLEGGAPPPVRGRGRTSSRRPVAPRRRAATHHS
jgi:hypothetical protein